MKMTGWLACAGGIFFMVICGQAQNLFVSGFNSNNIYEFTPGGVQSTFSTNLSSPDALAFDSEGNLYVADVGKDINNYSAQGSIVEIATNGSKNILVAGLNYPDGLAFNRAGSLFETDFDDGVIYEFTNHNGT